MSSRKLILLLFVFFPFITLSQGESNNWYFGYGAGLQFNNDGAVDTIYGGNTEASEGVSTISGRDGELLFYTDGGTVYNRNHEIMSNGDGLFGTEASTQSSVIVPLPQSPNRYYVFTVDATSPDEVRGRGLNYSVVDMSMDNGNGAVVEKNTNLLEDCTEKVAAVIGDCRSETIWIVTLATVTGAWNPVPPFPNFNTYHAFRMDASGVSPTSVTSTFPGTTPFDQGYLVFSPDGTKLANAYMQHGLFVSDFDGDTGVISNLLAISITGTPNVRPYGAAFSPNSQYLYVHTFKKRTGVPLYDSTLLQYDVLAADISASQVIIDDSPVFRGALQLGTDSKVYRTLSTDFDNGYVEGTPIETGTSYLGVVNNPNEKGLACNYTHNAIEIQGKRVRQGLPPLVQSFYTEVSLAQKEAVVVDDALAGCLGEPLVIETQNIPGATYTWEKDNAPLPAVDGNRFELPSVGPADAGNYSVTIIRPNAIECPINGSINVKVFEKPAGESLSITVCDAGDDDASDGVTATDLEEIFVAADFEYTFYTSPSDLESDTPIADPDAFINTVPFEQLLYYKVANAAGCENSGELSLEIRNAPDLVLEETYRLCTDQTADLVIPGPDGFDTYTWFSIENGASEIASTEKDFEVVLAGNYMLEAGIVLVNNGLETTCSTTTEFEVLTSNAAVIDEITVDRFTDNDTKVEITVSGDGDYEFSSDGSSYQESNIFENVNAGTVAFSVRDRYGCGIVTESVEVLPDTSSGFPNFFTPNGDGTNDVWQMLPVPEGEELNILEIRIFDRYGNFLAQIDPGSTGWDGNFNGKPLPASGYWYIATRSDGCKIRGHFTLKR